ncbi:MAG: hypothetical protein SNJ75_08995 [Gemmataceae bacterium]
MKAITVGFPVVNHALAALRYLVAGLDARHLARRRERLIDESPDTSVAGFASPDSLWTSLT